jgi:hypothetical protein
MAHFVQIVRIDRVFGGAEEGSWYYDRHTVLFSQRTTKRIADKRAKVLVREVCEVKSGEVELVLSRKGACMRHGSCKRCSGIVVQRAYRGRNRFSVLGGSDYMVIVTKRPMQNTGRQRYE